MAIDNWEVSKPKWFFISPLLVFYKHIPSQIEMMVRAKNGRIIAHNILHAGVLFQSALDCQSITSFLLVLFGQSFFVICLWSWIITYITHISGGVKPSFFHGFSFGLHRRRWSFQHRTSRWGFFFHFGKDVSESSIAASRKWSNSDYLYCDIVLEVPGKKGLFPNSWLEDAVPFWVVVMPQVAEAKEAKEEAKVEATTVHSRPNQAVWESDFVKADPAHNVKVDTRFAVPSVLHFALLGSGLLTYFNSCFWSVPGFCEWRHTVVVIKRCVYM